MENSIQQAYHDSPAPQTPTTPASKPLPALPVDTPPYSDDEDVPYHDEAPYRDDPPTPSSSSAPTTAQQPQPQQYTPYTDATPPPTPTPRLESSDDDIPLAHFLLNPYPHEAPPSYAVAIRQTQSRDTLIQYIPTLDEDAHARIQSSYQQFMQQQQQQQQGWSPSHHPPRAHRGRGRSVVIDIDEEAGLDGERSDDVRHSVEKIVAMFVVAGLLLVLSGVMAWLAFGSGLV